jgi:hypothetical protein
MQFNKTMVERTFSLGEAESKVIDGIAAEMEVSADVVVRQAVRLYQIVCERSKRGKPIDFTDPDVASKAPPIMVAENRAAAIDELVGRIVALISPDDSRCLVAEVSGFAARMWDALAVEPAEGFVGAATALGIRPGDAAAMAALPPDIRARAFSDIAEIYRGRARAAERAAPVSLESAEAAKRRFVAELLPSYPSCNGVGIGGKEEDYVVVVNFDGPVPADLPPEIDGVPVAAKTVGTIVLL